MSADALTQQAQQSTLNTLISRSSQSTNASGSKTVSTQSQSQTALSDLLNPLPPLPTNHNGVVAVYGHSALDEPASASLLFALYPTQSGSSAMQRATFSANVQQTLDGIFTAVHAAFLEVSDGAALRER